MGAIEQSERNIVASSSNEGAHNASSQKTGRPCINKQLRNTKMCAYYLKSSCTYGEACTFSHSYANLQDTPDLQKTRLCKAFIQGSCTDTGCRFAHGEEELRSTGNVFKKTLCIWFEKGKCRNGQQCRFAHSHAELHMHALKKKPTAVSGATAIHPKKEAAGADNGVACAAAHRPIALDVKKSVTTPHLDHHKPMKVNPPSLNCWPLSPALECPDPLYTSYMLDNLMRQYYTSAQDVGHVQNNRAMEEELGRLHEQVHSLSLHCNMLHEKMQGTASGFSQSTGSVVTSEYPRGTSASSSGSGSSRSLSQDIELLSRPPGLGN